MPYTSRMPDNPLRRMQAVTPSASTVYDPPIMLLRVGNAGTLSVVNLEGDTVLIEGVAAGEYVPGPFRQVLYLNTTAASLVGWKNE